MQITNRPGKKIIATLLAALCGCLIACGPDDSSGPDEDAITPIKPVVNGDTTTAGNNSGTTSGTGQVPGIDCEGICGPLVTKPPIGTGTVSDSGKIGTTPQTYVPGNTVVVQQCFRGAIPGDDTAALVKIKHSITKTPDGDVVTALVVFNRAFTDNTYGANAIGWGTRKGHTFDMLVKSDHVEFSLLDGNGGTVVQAKIDLISASAASPTGYASLGVDGGDGALIKGVRSDIVSTGSSMDDNFNRYGYALTVDSPATDSIFSLNPAYPYWNYFAVYRITVKLSAFGAAGFGKAMMTSVHASPSKFPENETIEVKEGSCPIPGPKDPFPGSTFTSGGSGPEDGPGGGGGGPDDGPGDGGGPDDGPSGGGSDPQ